MKMYTLKPIDRFVMGSQEVQGRIKGFILEIGCGKGKYTKYLGNEDIVGLDCNIDVLKGESNRICGDAQNLPFKANTFDSIICIAVLEHLTNPEFCVEEVNRVLKRGGYAIFLIPCLNIPLPILIPIYRKISDYQIEPEQGEHLHVFSTKSLVRMLNKNFDIMYIAYGGYFDILSRMKIFQRTLFRLDVYLLRLCRKIGFLKFFASVIWILVKTKKEGKNGK